MSLNRKERRLLQAKAKRQARYNLVAKNTAKVGVAGTLMLAFMASAVPANAATIAPFPIDSATQAQIDAATTNQNNSFENWQGSITNIQVDAAGAATLAAHSITLDSAGSVADSNLSNKSNNPGIKLRLSFDNAAFKAANPELANSIDASKSAANGYPSGLGAGIGEGNQAPANITSQAVTPKPNIQQGVLYSAFDKVIDATSTVDRLNDVGAYPASSIYEGSVSGEENATVVVDSFVNSDAQRAADSNLNGQRGMNVATFENCVVDVGACGIWITPVYSGETADGQQVTAALSDPIWVSVTTTYGAAAPAAWTASHPFVDAKGNKAWFTTSALDKKFNDGVNDAAVPLLPWKYAGELSAYEAASKNVIIKGSAFTDLADPLKTVHASLDLSTGLVKNDLTSVVTPGVDGAHKLINVTSSNPEVGDWLSGGDNTVLKNGDTWTQNITDGSSITFKVVSAVKGNLQLEASTDDGSPLTIDSAKPKLEVGVFTVGGGYSVGYLQPYTVNFEKNLLNEAVMNPKAVDDHGQGKFGEKITVELTKNDVPDENHIINSVGATFTDPVTGKPTKKITTTEGTFELSATAVGGKVFMTFTPAAGFHGTTKALTYSWAEWSTDTNRGVILNADGTVSMDGAVLVDGFANAKVTFTTEAEPDLTIIPVTPKPTPELTTIPQTPKPTPTPELTTVPETPKPTPTETSVVPADDGGVKVAPADDRGSMAYTGVNGQETGWLAGIAGTLLAAGLGLIGFTARKRRKAGKHS